MASIYSGVVIGRGIGRLNIGTITDKLFDNITCLSVICLFYFTFQVII